MIITKATQIRDASDADLLETYNAMMGETLDKFSSRVVAERRTEMALLSAKDRVGHAGVPSGTDPQPAPMNVAAREFTEAEVNSSENPFEPGTMAHGLWAPAKASVPKSQKASAGARATFNAVRATFAGTSRPQPGSERTAILTYIQDECANHIATIEHLDAKFSKSTRGYLQKLIEKNHLVALEPEGEPE